jgi:hypothetical protein
VSERISDERLDEIVRLAPGLAGARIGILTTNEFANVARELRQARARIAILEMYASADADLVMRNAELEAEVASLKQLDTQVIDQEAHDRDLLAAALKEKGERIAELEEALRELVFAAIGLVEEKYLRDARAALKPAEPKEEL